MDPKLSFTNESTVTVDYDPDCTKPSCSGRIYKVELKLESRKCLHRVRREEDRDDEGEVWGMMEMSLVLGTRTEVR